MLSWRASGVIVIDGHSHSRVHYLRWNVTYNQTGVIFQHNNGKAFQGQPTSGWSSNPSCTAKASPDPVVAEMVKKIKEKIRCRNAKVLWLSLLSLTVTVKCPCLRNQSGKCGSRCPYKYGQTGLPTEQTWRDNGNEKPLQRQADQLKGNVVLPWNTISQIKVTVRISRW